jgi:hypothetical protein
MAKKYHRKCNRKTQKKTKNISENERENQETMCHDLYTDTNNSHSQEKVLDCVAEFLREKHMDLSSQILWSQI